MIMETEVGHAVRDARCVTAHDCACGQELEDCVREHCPRCGRSLHH